ncbi:MAG TPA: proline--tRNA ligase [Methylomirabilota bacterium]|jgi:prolyl-tRNA synthetase|nr:proline--tRNA ligase [Methylomirabilota bacterium]
MRWSTSFIPTLREDPADAEAVSHRLMVRAGLVRQLTAGIYVYLPLGQRVIDRVNAIIREEMNAIGGQEITMPVLHPAELWQQSGRWYDIKDEMFRLKDRHGRDLCLGMTHEEVVAWLAAKEIRSYRELPQVWYQIQTKERDEARPRSGVLRTREFWMKDAYTLDVDEAGLAKAYDLQKEAYIRIFQRCGLRVHVVESDPGMMGGLGAHEFMAPSAAGEDDIALCEGCGYAANLELAGSRPAAPSFRDSSREEVATPGVRTIADVCALLEVEPALTLKTLVFVAKAGPVLALVRGDQQVHEKKLTRVLGGEVRPAHPDEVQEALGAPVGSVGPVGARLPIVADETLREGVYVCGANREGFHWKGIRPGRDFTVTQYADIHAAQAGEGCPRCGKALRVERVIEVGNIFKLGTKYSVPLKAVYLDERGQERPIVMGSYGIGPARIAAAAIEQRHDADGIVWPWSIAPSHVHVLPVNVKDGGVRDTAERLYRELREAGFDVLLDDRDERPGVKFKDADLLGIPLRVTVGALLAKEGRVEVRARRDRQDVKVPPAEVSATVKDLARRLAEAP